MLIPDNRPVVLIKNFAYRFARDGMLQKADIKGFTSTAEMDSLAWSQPHPGSWDEECDRANAALRIMTNGKAQTDSRTLKKLLHDAGLAIEPSGSVQRVRSPHPDDNVAPDVALIRALHAVLSAAGEQDAT
jgi:hypothetical protein